MSEDPELRPEPLRRDPERSRRRILDSAESLFAQAGLHGTAMQAIDAGAGVAQGTPGYFFGSKEQLYQAVLDRTVAARRDRLDAAAARSLSGELSADEALIDATVAYFDTLATDPNFLRLIDRESLGEHRVYKSEVQLDSLRQGVALIGELLERGGHAKIDPQQLFISILGMCEWSFSHEPLLAGLGFRAHERELLKARKRHITALLKAALGCPLKRRSATRPTHPTNPRPTHNCAAWNPNPAHRIKRPGAAAFTSSWR